MVGFVSNGRVIISKSVLVLAPFNNQWAVFNFDGLSAAERVGKTKEKDRIAFNYTKFASSSMINITKIFRFEAAHAIHAYPGDCAHIHGHSYELQVTVQAKKPSQDFIQGLGIIMDFKDLKNLVQEEAIKALDHKLILSKTYLAKTNQNFSADELVVFEVEPTAENLLLFLKSKIQSKLPENVKLVSLKLWETRDSFAEWLRG